MSKEEYIYLDHAGTTSVKSEVLDEMLPYFTNVYGNPSSICSISRESNFVIDTAREKIANAIGAKRQEIYFTGSGSEADNWAIKGIASAHKKKGNHIISTTIEHHAVLNTLKYLEKQGYEVTYLEVNEEGFISTEDFKAAIKETTILASIIFANNEIGTIEPIEEIGKICKEKKIIFHTDAVQAFGNVEIDVNKLNVDLLSIAAHKIYGPKGIGALYVRSGIRIDNLIHGGAQERNRRAGTENVPLIAGFGKAAEIAERDRVSNAEKMIKLRDKLITKLLEIPYTILNGPVSENRLPGNVNVCFEFIEGEGILLLLDLNKICASSGSACTSGSLDPSHVLLSIGRKHEIAHGSLRLSLGTENTEEQIDKVLETIPKIVDRLRSMSPLYADFIKKEKGGK